MEISRNMAGEKIFLWVKKGGWDGRNLKGRPKQFASDTANATGVDKRTVNRAISRAENIPTHSRLIKL